MISGGQREDVRSNSAWAAGCWRLVVRMWCVLCRTSRWFRIGMDSSGNMTKTFYKGGPLAMVLTLGTDVGLL